MQLTDLINELTKPHDTTIYKYAMGKSNMTQKKTNRSGKHAPQIISHNRKGK